MIHIRVKHILLGVILLIFGFHSISQAGENENPRDYVDVSRVVLKALSYYTKMNFDKMLSYLDKKAKAETIKLIDYIKTESGYREVKSLISTLSDPVVTDIKFGGDNLALVTVRWKVKRDVQKKDSLEKVQVSRETEYILEKKNDKWYIISYR